MADREGENPWSLIGKETHDRGNYIVMLNLKKSQKITVGELGKRDFQKGYYLYVGSARKNLTRRIERHRRRRKRLFWHIDYLRERADFLAVLPVRTNEQLECEIAGRLKDISNWSIPEFGSSDCSCKTHLFAMKTNPITSQKFIEILLYFRIDRLGDEL